MQESVYTKATFRNVLPCAHAGRAGRAPLDQEPPSLAEVLSSAHQDQNRKHLLGNMGVDLKLQATSEIKQYQTIN